MDLVTVGVRREQLAIAERRATSIYLENALLEYALNSFWTFEYIKFKKKLRIFSTRGMVRAESALFLPSRQGGQVLSTSQRRQGHLAL